MTDSDTTRTPIEPPENPPGAGASGTTDTPPPPSPAPPRSTPPTPAPSPSWGTSAPPPPPAPAWRPPPSDSGRTASFIVGAIILVIGLWFFATRTLDLDLPEIDWGSLWPLILIALGAWILLTAMRQRPR